MDLEPDDLDDDYPERGPAMPETTSTGKPTAKATTFVRTRTDGPLTLVHEGDPLPDGDKVEAVYDDAGGCWNPKPTKPKR